jgi:hypothetical protein
MTPDAAHASCKVISYVVLLLMLGTLGFAGYITILHWSGVGV